MMDPTRDIGRKITPPVQLPRLEGSWGVVQSSTAGPPKTLTITLSGSATSIAGVRYAAGYTPVNGDMVLVLRRGGDLFAIGMS